MANSNAATKSFASKSRFLAALIPIGLTIWLFVDAFVVAPDLHILPLHFNPYAVLSAMALLVNIVLMAYFYTKPARTEERVWLFVYMLAAALFSGAEMMQRLSVSPVGAGFWSNFVTVAAILPVATYMFALSYTNPSERRFPWLTSVLLVFPLIYVFFVNNTDIVYINTHITQVAMLKPWGWDFNQNGLGPAVGMVTIWYVFLNGLALARLISYRRHTKNPILRKQSLIFIFAVLIPLTFGAASEGLFPLLGWDIPPFTPQIGDMALILLIYGVVRYQLLTVNPASFSNTILNIVEESVVVTDDKYNVVYLNPKAEAMLGIKAEASSNVSLLNLMQPGSADTLQAAFTRDAAEHSKSVDIDKIDLKPMHAGPIPVRVAGSSLSLSDLDMRVIAMADITRELQTRSVIEHEVTIRTEELNEARAYLISSINSLEQGFVLVNRNSQVELANGVASRLFNLTSSEAQTKHIIDFARSISWNVDLGDLVHKVLDSRRYRHAQAETKDGSFYEIYITPVLSGDRELGATIIIQDVTEERILDRSKDEFFSIASHELRTPLTAIRGNMSMARDYFGDALKDENLRSIVDDTQAASVRLIQIVNDFLDSSRLEQGKMVFNLAPTAVKPVIESVRDDLASTAKDQGDTIELSGLEALPMIMADEGRFRQIVYNMLSNAIKYSQNASVTISAHADDAKLYIRFADTGKGMSPENQKLLFHKFQQAGDSILTRDNTKGTGLGLYISRLLATNMNGSVELEKSEEGKGSTFLLTMPLAKDK